MSAMTSHQEAAHIAVAGGGFTGLVCALKLLKAGYRVTILEPQVKLGGLTSSFNYGPFTWDRFYHCILTSDQALLTLLDELGLSDQLRWTATEVGFLSHGQLYTMTGPRELLRFPHLSLINKVRFGLAILYASKLTDGSRLEQIPLSAWTQRLFGERVYREMWEPLFRCKLGEMRHEASAAFLWGTLRRLYSTREKGVSKQEKLGYVHGGYSAVFTRLEQRVYELGAAIRTGAKVRSICSERDTSTGSPALVRVDTDSESLHFDGAILTLPNRALSAVLDTTTDTAYLARLGEVRYLGLICVVLLLKRRLSPFYVTNITQQSSFTGVIEMTNLINPEEETAGVHLIYLPRYTGSDDPLFEVSDADIYTKFISELRTMHPDLTNADIDNWFVFRERTVQPVPTLNYSRIAPPTRTPVHGTYVANTAQIINNTLNNNVMVGLAGAACDSLMRDIPATVNRAETIDSGRLYAAHVAVTFEKGAPCSPVSCS